MQSYLLTRHIEKDGIANFWLRVDLTLIFSLIPDLREFDLQSPNVGVIVVVMGAEAFVAREGQKAARQHVQVRLANPRHLGKR